MAKPRPGDLQYLQEQLELFGLIFDSIHNGAIVTDTKGIVTHLNKPYADFLGVSVADCIGKHCTDLVESSRMHIVARTGRPEINHMQMIRGQNIVVYRFPIKKEGRVIAAFGLVMFQDVGEMVKLAKRMYDLESQLKRYKKGLVTLRSTHYTLDSIIGNSRTIAELKQDALMAATNDYPVLIVGESGTGKELFAQGIHHASLRAIHPFVRINCAAIPKDLLEAELFGYDRGAFTGARSAGKPGKFELAHHGSIFLDEIGDLPLDMQPKLLRVLEEKVFERVGGNTVMQSDFRIIAATNQNLERRIREGGFRRDLYYRLNVISLSIPPLRARTEDIVPIARHLLRRSSQQTGNSEIGISPAAVDALLSHSWPGNVRELSNVLDRALATMGGETVEPGDLPVGLRPKAAMPADAGTAPIHQIQADAEKAAIVAALKKSGNNKVKAAALLGIHRTLLYKKMKKHAIALDGRE
ncbi:sigma-54 interaction domain-containing protein [Desulfosarcina ovata]|uniref:Sigma-54-dependent Fis family transcriptional regulator n=2 Tax=Desulfosarcina ovata TaxID=83564 RepID=A0A5K8AIP7_9BACT|nr:sigma 54-interacting transcriptional regulator [Desulfosarcina ovata]BBO82662.1 sigma-54-dependent Fis family transcriptional regulator [Desulfosarcina ovata subsp. sediminis]BBO92369.1 sigma-54-dependent Fis family transcriptional regulator [Desulfosarcina ovata subsp. ovata]